MLKQLIINNLILIDSLKISFQEGFNVITGETGAGKSILLGALSLLLGERADRRFIRELGCEVLDMGAYAAVMTAR